jgi:hypothetical protein
MLLPGLGSCGGLAASSPPAASPSPGANLSSGRAAGPLVVSRVNPRYFTVRSGDSADGPAVLLTGSHINNNFQDGGGPGLDCAKTPERSDFDSYLQFLADHGHNFVRLWRWEHFKSQLGGGKFHMCMSPQPWPRSGSGRASDGKPKFDLSRFDPAYFDRLRRSVIAAGDRGIYVSVMLFEGHGLHLSSPPDHVEGHPFHAGNNVNGIGVRSIVDYQVLPLDPRIEALQEAYIRKVIDTVHDLPNVLYEVANESSGDTGNSVKLPDGTTIATPIGDSTAWQYRVIDFVKHYEGQMGYEKHPVGMTMQYPVPDQRKVNAPLFKSHADWISPGFDEPVATAKKGDGPPAGRWLLDPPPNDGTKVILSDTDHYSPFKNDALWAWKSFLRGHNPVLYDFGIATGAKPPHPVPGLPPYEASEPARNAMGDALRYARKVKLLEMVPHGELSSTGFVLAHPGQEYLVLQPSKDATSFTVKLAVGTYVVEWYGVDTRKEFQGKGLTVERPATVELEPPVAPAVLYLKRAAP